MQINRAIAPLVDVMIGNEEDFSAALGLEVPGLDAGCSRLDPANFKKMIARAVEMFPNFRAVATTLRQPASPCRTAFLKNGSRRRFRSAASRS